MDQEQTKMTLRDLFASSVIGVLIQSRGYLLTDRLETARIAYNIADAMIIARGEKDAE